MRYHYEKPEKFISKFGITYKCNHPVYDACTLIKINIFGLAIIQQRYNPDTKNTWWSEIDPWLINDIYLHPNFIHYFKERAKEPINNLYPTVTIRQVMWALRMKPIKKEPWETCFDRKEI